MDYGHDPYYSGGGGWDGGPAGSYATENYYGDGYAGSDYGSIYGSNYYGNDAYAPASVPYSTIQRDDPPPGVVRPPKVPVIPLALLLLSLILSIVALALPYWVTCSKDDKVTRVTSAQDDTEISEVASEAASAVANAFDGDFNMGLWRACAEDDCEATLWFPDSDVCPIDDFKGPVNATRVLLIIGIVLTLLAIIWGLRAHSASRKAWWKKGSPFVGAAFIAFLAFLLLLGAIIAWIFAAFTDSDCGGRVGEVSTNPYEIQYGDCNVGIAYILLWIAALFAFLGFVMYLLHWRKFHPKRNKRVAYATQPYAQPYDTLALPPRDYTPYDQQPYLQGGQGAVGSDYGSYAASMYDGGNDYGYYDNVSAAPTYWNEGYGYDYGYDAQQPYFGY